MSVSLLSIQSRMDQVGLGHIGVLPSDVYDRTARDGQETHVLAPSAKSILVLASNGRRLWDSFLESIESDPEVLTGSPHPLDDFVRREVRKACLDLGLHGYEVFYADERAPVHLDFRDLAVRAGVGATSRLGLVIHPEYGPWMGLRAAIFVQEQLPASKKIEELCGGCKAPCAPACPGGALASGHWDVGICIDVHNQSSICADSCAARSACIVGVDYKYSPMEILYHSNRRTGRNALRNVMGIKNREDPFQGEGPNWGGSS